MSALALEGGFAEPALDAARAFRGIMEAMARPGTIHDVTGATPPAPLSAAAGAVLLTLCDGDTKLHLAGDYELPALRDWVAFHTGAPLASADDCDFALGRWDDLLPLDPYRIGTSEYPDRSATLIVDMPELAANGASLRGPGIKGTAALSLPDLDPFRDNRALFPLGRDFLFTCGTRIAALPRSTEVL
ncbi:MAG: phosphonate C-P lyase system protein PhnH [Pelagimonas sp.]|jgi:alpha-D-ribose 1-methylphosphonate 5-triphosphate synthase subunit PhnH|nr:phosphonate C-P lyase system protein PhnH [Pelagimonas sp.]